MCCNDFSVAQRFGCVHFQVSHLVKHFLSTGIYLPPMCDFCRERHILFAAEAGGTLCANKWMPRKISPLLFYFVVLFCRTQDKRSFQRDCFIHSSKHGRNVKQNSTVREINKNFKTIVPTKFAAMNISLALKITTTRSGLETRARAL